MASQIPLIPISESEFTKAAFELALLLLQMEDEEENWKEARQAHKETMTVLKKGVSEKRQVIRRKQLELEEGLTAAQVNALMNEATEREDAEPC